MTDMLARGHTKTALSGLARKQAARFFSAALAVMVVFIGVLAAMGLTGVLAPLPSASAVELNDDTKIVYNPKIWHFTIEVAGAGTLELADIEADPNPEPDAIPPWENTEGTTPASAPALAPAPAQLRLGTSAPTAPAAPTSRLAPQQVSDAVPALPGISLRNESQVLEIAKNSIMVFRFVPDGGARHQGLTLAGQDIFHWLGQDGTLRLSAADANASLRAEFSDAPALPSIAGGSGSSSGLGALGDTLGPFAWVLVALGAAGVALVSYRGLRQNRLAQQGSSTARDSDTPAARTCNAARDSDTPAACSCDATHDKDTA